MEVTVDCADKSVTVVCADKSVTVVCADNSKYVLPEKVWSKMTMIKNIIDDCGNHKVNLPNIQSNDVFPWFESFVEMKDRLPPFPNDQNKDKHALIEEQEKWLTPTLDPQREWFKPMHDLGGPFMYRFLENGDYLGFMPTDPAIEPRYRQCFNETVAWLIGEKVIELGGLDDPKKFEYFGETPQEIYSLEAMTRRGQTNWWYRDHYNIHSSEDLIKFGQSKCGPGSEWDSYKPEDLNLDEIIPPKPRDPDESDDDTDSELSDSEDENETKNETKETKDEATE